ncbi:hypothetical protein LTR62_008159 [Meristemomyces frigidus]|uniref:LIM zinc-binding domain-containing protein n=1 Tax=Meristemomyces frigidus TaxID=1508187 RepID=A0AAN7TB06_9PEZI|nr:hypothetical protein LTR62_008159 [Meristemomyces frigidus]
MVTEDEDLHHDLAGQYLKDLRTQRLARPSGSRPAPPSKYGSLRRADTAPNMTQELDDGGSSLPRAHESERTATTPMVTSMDDERPLLPSSNSMPAMTIPRLAHRRPDSGLQAKSPFAGRPLARPPSTTPEDPVKALAEIPAPSVRPTSLPYMENGMRWMEKQEAKSLRMALEDMDLEKDKRIHDSAQDEAAELVWKHQNPGAPFANPETAYANPDVKRDYNSHLRRGSYMRSHSQEKVPSVATRKSSGGSQQEMTDNFTANKSRSTQSSRKVSPSEAIIPGSKNRSPSGKSYGGLAEAVGHDVAKAFRRTSGGSKRIMSSDKSQMRKHDRIWEDPQEGSPQMQLRATVLEPTKPAITPIQPPAYVRKNPFARVRMQQHGRLEHSTSAPVLPVAKHDRVEIQRNAPSQSRRAFYTANESLPSTPPSSREEPLEDASPKATPTKDGIELRSDDIRAATSKQRKDRSPRLPQPTLVSDKPGRPIVSFKQDLRPKEVVLEEVHTDATAEPRKSPQPADSTWAPPITTTPEIRVDGPSMPAVPTIVFPNDPTVPSIVLPEEPDFASSSIQSQSPTPSINVEPPTVTISHSDNESLPSNLPPKRPLPIPTRPGVHHAATTPLPTTTAHRTMYTRHTGTLCAHCALPIAGRILSAAGSRFHPHCFTCHQCHTNLEHVAFYPEPEKQRHDRLARIHARSLGAEVPGMHDSSMTEQDFYALESTDGDPGARFYCHLDYHELFSPRCKSCHTPIEGEIIVACGAEWHAGHFFCAQCGDPFDSTTPFVEKEGYAWCVGCHTNRFSEKCRGCRKPVTDVVVKALGGDWHGSCFVCVVSTLHCERGFG